jgi:ATP-binding cassette subfamily B protein
MGSVLSGILFPHPESLIGTLRQMLPWLRPYRRALLWGALAVLGSNAFAVLGPWILKGGIDTLNGEAANPRPLWQWATAMVVAAACGGVFLFLMRNTLIGVSRHVEYDLRRKLFAHLQRLPLPFFERYEVGDLMARVTNDLNSVRMFLGPGLMYLVNTVLVLGFSIVLMLRISPELTAWAMLPMPLITFSVILVMRAIHERVTRVQEGFATLTTRVRESLEGVRVVKAFAVEEGQILRFEAASDEYLERNMALARVQRLFMPAMSLFSGIAFAVVLWKGGKLVISDSITLGSFVAFTSYLALLMWPMAALGWTINLYQRGRASWFRLADLLQEPPEPVAEDGVAPAGDGAIRFEGVTLRRGDRAVLRDLDLTIGAGERVALVGPTGAGKSTALKLLGRLLPPTSGAILLDDVPLEDWPLAALRRELATVPQETFLFSDSLARNVEVGRPGADRDEVVDVARQAHLLDEIEAFQNGFDTVVGERGVTLSGGQRQRATLARALLREARVLVLDDAFANMDTRTEESILSSLPRNRTTILVSHRLSTIRRADRILYLEDGRILEDGTHDELVAQGERYARYVHRQQILEALTGGDGPDEEAA